MANDREPFSYVRNYYGVPAALGRRVVIGNRPGIIAADRGHYIGVTFDTDKPGTIHNAHPVDSVTYGGMGTIRPMTASQRRYSEFLDADCGHTFGEWLKGRAALKALEALQP
jgi:hypothetical protein